MTADRHDAGFKRRTRLPAARSMILDAVAPLGRSEAVPVSRADGRVVAGDVSARRPVPHYPRAAMDGYAVRASDTFDATERSPVTLRVADDVAPGTAVRVHTGSELPDGADAVVMIEHVERFDDELEVLGPVAEGENVGTIGEDVSEGQQLVEAGQRLRPADLGLLKTAGVDTVDVFDEPVVVVIPTGDELVQSDPEPGEVVESNGLTVSRFVDRWGGQARYRDVVTDDRAAIEAAIDRGLESDVVVTTGGSSVGERDVVPDVVDEMGDVLVHGVAVKPGHPVALGRVEETPIVMLPGYPVSCIVTAVQLLCPLIKRVGHYPTPDHPTTRATLSRKVASEPGIRSYVRVSLEPGEEGPDAVPVRASGAGVLSSVSFADGWIAIPEDLEGYDTGRQVLVEDWGWMP